MQVRELAEFLEQQPDLNPWSFRLRYSPERLTFAIKEPLPETYQLSVELETRDDGPPIRIYYDNWCKNNDQKIRCDEEKRRILEKDSETNVIVREFLERYGPSLAATLKRWLTATMPPAPDMLRTTTDGLPGMCRERCGATVRESAS